MELFIPANFFCHFIFRGTKESRGGGRKSLHIFVFGFVVGLFVCGLVFVLLFVLWFQGFFVFLFLIWMIQRDLKGTLALAPF